MYKLISGAKDSDNLSTGFNRDLLRRQRESTNKKYERKVPCYNYAYKCLWFCRT